MRVLGVVRPNPSDPQCADQHGAINDYCARHGWSIVDVLYGTADDDVAVAIGRVEARDADALVAAVSGTLWENRETARTLLERRARNDWALVITEIGLDTTTSIGMATVAALSSPVAVPPCSRPLPPRELAKRVCGTIDLEHFDVSAGLDLDLLEAALGEPLRDRARILDFGCGCGRLLRRLVDRAPASRFAGCDIDAEAVAWVRERLGVDASVTGALPPLPYDDGVFDLVIGFSVFTHLDEAHQDAWLAELRRVLAPGGAALLTVHGPAAWETTSLTALAGRPALAELAQEREERGIVHWRDDGWEAMFPDWYHTTFHTPRYVREHWARWFPAVDVVPGTVLRNHDIVVVRRDPPA
jgi:SAM-dependent methyltransferase